MVSKLHIPAFQFKHVADLFQLSLVEDRLAAVDDDGTDLFVVQYSQLVAGGSNLVVHHPAGQGENRRHLDLFGERIAEVFG